jgi:phage virion morphogenesis protein
MAGTSIQVEVTGDLNRFQEKLGRLVRLNFTDLHRQVGHAVLNSTLQRFKDGVDPDGKPWPKSQRVLGKKRGRKGRKGTKTLIDTGRLRSSLTVAATADEAVVGTNTIYARIHQYGGKTGRGRAVKMPARPYLGLNDDDRAVIDAIVEGAIEEAMR